MAKERNLFVTGGSDYHGIPNRYPYHLGEYVVDSNLINQFYRTHTLYICVIIDVRCTMEVIAFVGGSGTGKSHRALVLAHENSVECIIDDGILIHDNKIVAGFSAKKESSRLKAVRRAIFQDPVQVKEVRSQLDVIKPNRLMIIGTSDNMVKKLQRHWGFKNQIDIFASKMWQPQKKFEKAQYDSFKGR